MKVWMITLKASPNMLEQITGILFWKNWIYKIYMIQKISTKYHVEFEFVSNVIVTIQEDIIFKDNKLIYWILYELIRPSTE